MKQSTEMNLIGSESQLVGGRPIDYVQAQLRSWTKHCLEQIQLVVKAELELRISRFQVRRPNYLATFLPEILQFFWLVVNYYLKGRRVEKWMPINTTISHTIF